MESRMFKLLLVLGVFIFLFGVFAKLNAPLVEWDRCHIPRAESVAKGQGLPSAPDYNPPLYILYLAFWFRLFGVGNSIGRLANVCALLLTAYIVWQTARSLMGKNSGLLAAVVYLLSPVVIQGSSLMDLSDTNLLHLGFALFMWMVIRGYRNLSAKSYIFLTALIIALCFWLKVTSTIALTVSIFFWFFLKYRSIHYNEGKKIILGTILGIIIFILSWITISLILWDKSSCLAILLNPLVMFKGKVIIDNFFLRIAEFLLHSLRIIFWFSPFLILLFLYTLRLVEKGYYGDKTRPLAFLGWVSFFYFFSHLFIGGAAWGFPRYHAPVLPFLAVLTAVVVEPLINRFTRKEACVFLGSIVGLSLIYVFALDDPILLLNLEFKKAALLGNMDTFAMNFLVQGFFYLVLPAFIVFFLRKTFLNRNLIDKIIVFLFAGIIISNTSLDIKQARATYITSYGYGAQGKEELVSFVLERINKGDTVLAIGEFWYEFRDKEVPYIPLSVWFSAESVLKKLKESKTKVFILGLTTHTVGQLQEFLNNSQIVSILNDEYERRNIGTYSVWVRKIKDK